MQEMDFMVVQVVIRKAVKEARAERLAMMRRQEGQLSEAESAEMEKKEQQLRSMEDDQCDNYMRRSVRVSIENILDAFYQTENQQGQAVPKRLPLAEQQQLYSIMWAFRNPRGSIVELLDEDYAKLQEIIKNVKVPLMSFNGMEVMNLIQQVILPDGFQKPEKKAPPQQKKKKK